MIHTIEDLALGAIELPPDQRLTLANRILASIEPDEEPAIDIAWSIEIRERIRKYDMGEARGIPASEVFAEIDQHLPR